MMRKVLVEKNGTDLSCFSRREIYNSLPYKGQKIVNFRATKAWKGLKCYLLKALRICNFDDYYASLAFLCEYLTYSLRAILSRWNTICCKWSFTFYGQTDVMRYYPILSKSVVCFTLSVECRHTTTDIMRYYSILSKSIVDFTHRVDLQMI